VCRIDVSMRRQRRGIDREPKTQLFAGSTDVTR
jgi:hypothetical protein